MMFMPCAYKKPPMFSINIGGFVVLKIEAVLRRDYYISFLSSQYSHSRRVSSPLERKLFGR